MTSGGGAAAPIRVLFLSSHAQLGGGEAYMRSIVEGLDEGFAADVVSLHDGPFVERLREGGHEVTVLPAHGRAGILTGVRALRRRLREQRADVVHANGVKAALIAVLAALPSGPPVVWCKFDFAWDGWLADLVAQRCRLVVGISAAVNEALAPRHRERTRVVWAGIPDYPDRREHGAALVREWLGGAPDGPLIALSGRLCPGKGQLDLVEALPAVLEQHPRARAILLGVPDTFYPDFRGRLEQRAAELGVTDAVLFAPLEGHRPGEAVAVVSACDVLAQPSQLQERGGWKEGFGLTAVEAMHVGTPVVAYANGALPEVLGDCGVTVPEGDSAALAAGINRVLGDAQLREQLTACGRARARERFQLSRVVREMAACYREAAGRPATAG